MDPKYIRYIAGGIAAFLLLQFVLIPFISRQKASATVKAILENWAKDDAVAAAKYFMEPEQSPPIYDLKSYTIKSQRFGSVNGKKTAQFWVELEFPPGNVLPSERTWVGEMVLDKGNWRAISFKLSQ